MTLSKNNLTLDELHEVVDQTGQGQTDEEYQVVVVDESNWNVYRVEEVRVNHENGMKMLALVFNGKDAV